LVLVEHQKVMRVRAKEMLVQTRYLTPSLLMVAVVEAEVAVLAEQVATVVLAAVAVLVLALVEQQLLGRVMMEELHQGQCLPRRTMDALVAVAQGQ